MHNLRHLNVCYLLIYIMLFCVPYLVSYIGELHWTVVCIVQKPVIPWSYQLMYNTLVWFYCCFARYVALSLSRKVHQVKHKQPSLSLHYLHAYFMHAVSKSLLVGDVWSSCNMLLKNSFMYPIILSNNLITFHCNDVLY